MSPPPSKKYHLFGYPIAHSAAPAMHNDCFNGLGMESTYTIWSTSKVTNEVLDIVHSDECGGAAVTMPIKTAIIPFLDELSPESQITNACNTIVKVPTPNGGVKLVGQNTDILGVRNALLSALKEQHPASTIPSDASAAYPPNAGSGLVIGGGATTRSAAHALTLLGLAPIFLINRDLDEVRAVMDAMPHLSAHGRLIHLRDPADVENHLVGKGKARILTIVGCIRAELRAANSRGAHGVHHGLRRSYRPIHRPNRSLPRPPLPHTTPLPRDALQTPPYNDVQSRDRARLVCDRRCAGDDRAGASAATHVAPRRRVCRRWVRSVDPRGDAGGCRAPEYEGQGDGAES